MIKCCQLLDLILGFRKILFKPQEFVKFWSLWNCLLLLMKLLFWGPRGSFWFLVSFLDSEDRKIFISFLSIDSWEIESFLIIKFNESIRWFRPQRLCFILTIKKKRLITVTLDTSGTGHLLLTPSPAFYKLPLCSATSHNSLQLQYLGFNLSLSHVFFNPLTIP